MDEKTSNPPVLNLAAFVPKDNGASRTVEVEFKGVRFTVRHVNRSQLFSLGQSCTILSYDATTKSRTPRLDLPKLSRALADAILVSWSNATFRTLQNLMVLEGIDKLTPEQLDTPLEFTPENLQLVLSNANGLDEFLQEVAMDPANFRNLPPADAAKN